MKIIIIICSCIFFLSCASLKWKNKYINKNLTALQIKYGIPPDYGFKISYPAFVDKPYNRLTKRDVKKNVAAWEKIYTLIPDSVFSINENIDSFYTNRNKINNIIRNGLQTKSIHFINDKR